MERGKRYEEYVNKFIRGNIVSTYQDYYDIETKTTIYEVKGVKIYHEKSFGRYKINLENHNNLLIKSQELKKIPKYIFVLKIDTRMIWKSFSWEAVNSYLKNAKIHKCRDKEVANVSVREIW